MKILIVGGVAGGASAAARLRRLDENNQIIMFERGADISYANCGIPYYLGDVIKDRSQLTIVSKESFNKQFNVNVRIQSEVLSVDRKAKKIKVLDHSNNNTYEESYDKLVLSPGGLPIRPAIPGINDSRIFTIRNLSDMDLVKNFINEHKPKKAAIVGAGFIGLEMAENMHHLGLRVSIIELADQVLNVLDGEMAAIIHDHLKLKNIELVLNNAVTEFKQTSGGLKLALKDGYEIEADFVILSIGVKPETALAKEAGLELGSLGGIKVTPELRTSDSEIFALGDAIETKDSVCDCPCLVPLANAANKQGRIVADNIMGGKETYEGTPGTAIAKIFDLAAAITGSSEKILKKRKIAYNKCYLNPSSHAGYYPDAFPLYIKFLYSPLNGRVLGAQIVGPEGVDKRIDVLAVMVQLHRTVYELAKLELAYAPPFSSAKDPVNLAAMIAINQMKGRNPCVSFEDVETLKKEKALFVDVRSNLEFELGQINGAVNIPLSEIRERMNEIPKDKKIIMICNQGKMAYFAQSILKNSGYQNVYALNGGFKLYKVATAPQQNVGIFQGHYIDKRDDIRTVIPGKGNIYQLDAGGLQCPGPIMALAKKMAELQEGDVVEVTATDAGFRNDIPSWCETTGNMLVSIEEKDKKIVAKIQKGKKENKAFTGDLPHDKTIVVFSGELDKVLAAFVIANGASSMGRKVTMFFTFWGLNALKKNRPPKTKKGFFDFMFGLMLPRGTFRLKLSQMQLFGFGPRLIRFIMKKKNIDSLEAMLFAAKAAGVRIIACQMSMDMMGIVKEELIDGIDIGGVAMYLNSAELGDTNLFIS
ncbi:MAG: FAD-dependent oxidoreductase [Candidatus Firestonebacteria bacterium]|nr:FAD-dependent oxidoreductase [Candidatus Firestonebacteria bacterium]